LSFTKTTATASLSLVGKVSIVRPEGKIPTTEEGRLAVGAFAPTTLVTHLAVPDTASLTLVGQAPTASISALIVSPAVARLTLTAFAPTEDSPIVTFGPAARFTLTAKAVTSINSGDDLVQLPGIAATSITSYAPIVTVAAVWTVQDEETDIWTIQTENAKTWSNAA